MFKKNYQKIKQNEIVTKQFGFEEKKTPSQISDDEDKIKPTITKIFKS